MIQNTVMSIYRKADEKKQNIFENLYLLFFVMITVMAFKDTTMFSYGWTDTQLHLVFILGFWSYLQRFPAAGPGNYMKS